MLALPPLGTLETWQMAMAAVHPQDQAALAEAVQQCVAAGGGFCSEFKIVRHDGAQTWIRATGRKLAGGAEQPPSVQGVMDDITPRRRGEAERIDLLRRLAQAQEDERRRISRDLHDQIGQTVTGLSLSLKALERDGAMTPSRMTSLQAMVAAISRDIHQAAVALRPSVLDDLGLVRALQALAASSAEASGMRIDVQAVGLTTRLSSEIETVIYRLVQEALTNVMKHAEASAVSILLDRGTEQIRVIVEDDGVGFDVEWRTGRNDTAHLGLSSMRERLALIGGSMTIESARGSGTTLFIQLPVAQHQPEARL
jgi:signal transduction histidine kinase